MDTQKPVTLSPTPTLNSTESLNEFKPGSSVIYAIHGKCQIVGRETREINGESISFYKLEIQKSSLSRSNRKEPAIWIPITSAKERGLRSPITTLQAEEVFKILFSREYYFEINLPWTVVQPRLETSIRTEGAIGLAKVASYLYVLKRKQLVPSMDINRFQETVNKLLLRELSDATGQSVRNLEDQIAKAFRQKATHEN